MAVFKHKYGDINEKSKISAHFSDVTVWFYCAWRTVSILYE